MARRVLVLLLAMALALVACGDEPSPGGGDQTTPDDVVTGLQAKAWDMSATWTVGDDEVRGVGDLDMAKQRMSFTVDSPGPASQIFVEGESYLSPAGPGCEDFTWAPGLSPSETPSLGSTGVVPGYWYDGLLWLALLDYVEWEQQPQPGSSSSGALDLAAVSDDALVKSVETLQATVTDPIDVVLTYDADLDHVSMQLDVPDAESGSRITLSLAEAPSSPDISVPADTEVCSVGTLGQ